MHSPREPFELTLPPQAVANATYALDEKLSAAHRFLSERGIHEVRPVYGRAAQPKSRTGRALVSRFEVRPAANDGAGRRAVTETAA